MTPDVTRQSLPVLRYDGCPFEELPPPPGAVAAEAIAPGDLPPHLLAWLTIQAHKAAIMAELDTEPARSAIRQVK